MGLDRAEWGEMRMGLEAKGREGDGNLSSPYREDAGNIREVDRIGLEAGEGDRIGLAAGETEEDAAEERGGGPGAEEEAAERRSGIDRARSGARLARFALHAHHACSHISDAHAFAPIDIGGSRQYQRLPLVPHHRVEHASATLSPLGALPSRPLGPPLSLRAFRQHDIPGAIFSRLCEAHNITLSKERTHASAVHNKRHRLSSCRRPLHHLK